MIKKKLALIFGIVWASSYLILHPGTDLKAINEPISNIRLETGSVTEEIIEKIHYPTYYRKSIGVISGRPIEIVVDRDETYRIVLKNDDGKTRGIDVDAEVWNQYDVGDKGVYEGGISQNE